MTRGRFGGHVPLLPPLGSGTDVDSGKSVSENKNHS